MKILAIDLEKFNSAACLFDTPTNQGKFEKNILHSLEFAHTLFVAGRSCQLDQFA